MPDWRTLALVAWCALGGLAVALMFGGMIGGTLEAMGPWTFTGWLGG